MRTRRGHSTRSSRFVGAGVALLAGVVTTVIISWLAMFLPWDDGKWYGPPTDEEVGIASRSDGMKTFQITRGSNAWHEVTSYWWMQISGRSLMLTGDDVDSRHVDVMTLPSHMRPDSIDDLNMLSWYHATGWPVPAMTCGVHWQTQISNADVIYRTSGGVQLPRDSEFNPRALPLTPLWPGFAVNVLLYAGVWWLVTWSTGTLRQRHRMKRNRCVRCGYSRQGLAVGSACPECGNAPTR